MMKADSGDRVLGWTRGVNSDSVGLALWAVTAHAHHHPRASQQHQEADGEGPYSRLGQDNAPTPDTASGPSTRDSLSVVPHTVRTHPMKGFRLFLKH